MEVLRASVWSRGEGCAWVCRRGNRVIALVAAARRSGPQSWEVTQLHVAPGEEGQVPKLLEKTSGTAAADGAKRVFITLVQDDPLADVARIDGFFPCVVEVLYAGPNPLQTPGDSTRPSLRPKARSDDHDLFRLYNAATPAEVRARVGMTLEQWVASQERRHRRAKEFVLDEGSGLRGWLMVRRRSGTAQLAAMAHPDDRGSLERVVDFGLDRVRDAGTVFVVAPEYQSYIDSILSERGLRPASYYTTFIKSLAVAAADRSRVRATAASS